MIYEKVYNSLIEKRKKNIPIGYKEKHHIVPRSFGGNNRKSNLVYLTAREHFIAHYLLMKMQVPNTPRYFSALKAFLMMNCSKNSPHQSRYMSSHSFCLLREKDSLHKSLSYVGEGNSQYGTVWICDPKTGTNKKIKKEEEIPEGFYPGKNLKIQYCECCFKKFTNSKLRSFCCVECSKQKAKDDKFVKYEMTKLLSVSKYGRADSSQSIITKEIVKEIRSGVYSHLGSTEIGKLFGVSRITIYHIQTFKTWI